jgi:hypothetical protein
VKHRQRERERRQQTSRSPQPGWGAKSPHRGGSGRKSALCADANVFAYQRG